tara:strand:- start:497 stop:751 length:255 start_codon:yes stop_codon:yes gene_type:complete
MERLENNMPTYTLKDIKTQEEWDVLCTWGELQETLDAMPDVIQVLSTPKIVANQGSLLSKTDDGWKENLKRIKAGSGSSSTIKV